MEDCLLGGGVRVIDIDVHQKTVELGFRQRVGAFLLDRVLRRHHQKQFGQRVGFGTDGDLALGHRFKQRRLHLGRRAVDFIGQNQVMKQRPLLEFE